MGEPLLINQHIHYKTVYIFLFSASLFYAFAAILLTVFDKLGELKFLPVLFIVIGTILALIAVGAYQYKQLDKISDEEWEQIDTS